MATQDNSLNSLLSLIQTFTGKSGTETTSGGTTTKQTVLDQETLNKIMQSALEGNSGLASVASGQRAAGMYNSTVNTQLTNDLLSRLATQTAVAGAPTVTTTPKTTVSKATAGAGAGSLAALAALGLGKNALDPFLKGKKGIADIIGTNTSAGPSDAFDSGLAASVDSLGTEAVAATGALPLDAVSGADVISAFSDAAGATGDYILGEALDASSIGDVISAGSDVVDAVDLGSEAADAVDVTKESLSAFDGCFLTTAVCEYQGKPDNCYELTLLRGFRDSWLKENHPEAIEEYYREAPALVAKIKSSPAPAYLFDRMYNSYILPAIEYLEEGNHAGAYRIYKQLFQFCSAI